MDNLLLENGDTLILETNNTQDTIVLNEYQFLVTENFKNVAVGGGMSATESTSFR